MVAMDPNTPLHEKLVRRLEEARRRTAEERPRTDAAIAAARRQAAGEAPLSAETLAALLAALDAARRSDDDRGRLLADVSHDLKQPLLVLRMSVEMLERRLPEKVGRREIERLERTLDKMQEALEALERAAKQAPPPPDDAGG
jgi:signal transduction histidine kinase